MVPPYSEALASTSSPGSRSASSAQVEAAMPDEKTAAASPPSSAASADSSARSVGFSWREYSQSAGSPSR